MSYTNATRKTHAALLRAVEGRKGQSLRTREIRALILETAPEIGSNIQWFHPSDHCQNHTPKGACECAGQDAAPLRRIARGLYLIP